MRLSVQLYTVREHLEKDVPGTLTKIRDMGLEYVELAGMFGKSAEEWKSLLDGLGLKVSGSHQGIDGLVNEFDKTVADNKTLGNPYVVVPWIGEDQYKDGWDKFAEKMNDLGRKVKAAGLQLGYHNHAFEFPNGLDTFYSVADPSLVVAELDLAWVQIGGADPAGFIKKCKGRVPLIHLKDFDPSKDPQWRPAGEGLVDWDACLAAAADANVEFGCIELDQSPGDSIEAVRKSVAFFQGKGLK